MSRFLALAGSLLLLAPATALGQPAAAATVDRAAIERLIARGALWCENPGADHTDCEAIYLLRRDADGSLVSTSMFQLSISPDVVVVTAQPARLIGDRICTAGDLSGVNLQVTIDGQRAPEEATGLLRAQLTAAMTAYSGKVMCQRLIATADPAILEEEITADGVRLPEFESRYYIGDARSPFTLQARAEPTAGDRHTL